jgi:hypothetical protein
MEDETSRLAEKAKELGDLELAALLCLITGEHCIIEVNPGDVEQAEQELHSVRSPLNRLHMALADGSRYVEVHSA